jgi:hypothetical protein
VETVLTKITHRRLEQEQREIFALLLKDVTEIFQELEIREWQVQNEQTLDKMLVRGVLQELQVMLIQEQIEVLLPERIETKMLLQTIVEEMLLLQLHKEALEITEA